MGKPTEADPTKKEWAISPTGSVLRCKNQNHIVNHISSTTEITAEFTLWEFRCFYVFVRFFIKFTPVFTS